MKRILLIFAAVLYCWMTIGAQASQMKSKMSPWLQSQYKSEQAAMKKNGGPIRVNGRAVRKYILTLVQSADGNKAIREQGGVVWQDFGDGICAAFLPVANLGELCKAPSILHMEANPASKLLNDTSAVIIGVDKAWGFENTLNAQHSTVNSSIPQAFTGKGVIAAVMDCGFDFTHPAFRNEDGTSRIQWFWDPMTEESDPNEIGRIYDTPEKVLEAQHTADAEEACHGSHVLGSMAGRGLNGRYVGMAPEADIMGARIPLGMGSEYEESLAEYIAAHSDEMANIKSDLIQLEPDNIIELVVLHRLFQEATAAGKPCVVNWSFGDLANFMDDHSLYETVFNKMVGPGRIVVNSAGNDGDRCLYLKKEANEPLDHPAYLYYNREYRLGVRTADPAEPFVIGVTFDGSEDTLYVDTRNVTEEYTEEKPYTGMIEFVDPEITDEEMYDTIQIWRQDFAYGRTGFIINIKRYNYQWENVAHLIVKDPVELEFMGTPDAEFIWFEPMGERPNRGCNLGTIGFPEGLERIICVGAMHHRDRFKNIAGKYTTFHNYDSQEGQLAAFSSCGPIINGRVKPDVVAPGHNIISVLNSFITEENAKGDGLDIPEITVYKANVFDKEYRMLSMSGTSMSSPIAAGVIALWLQAKPDLTPEDILGVIERTSHQPEPEFSGTDKNNYYGWGEIDAYAGLLDILGLGTSIPELSKHQPAGVKFRLQGNTLYIDGAEDGTDIRIYTTDGRLVTTALLMGGSVNIPETAGKGVFAVQLGKQGSTLIRL